MRLTIKAKQVAGVTSIVGFVVLGLSAIHLTSLVSVALEESASRGEMMSHAIYQRAREVVASSADPQGALRDDPGIRSLLESGMAYSKNVTYVAIADTSGRAIAHSFRTQEGKPMPPQADLVSLAGQNALVRLRAVYSDRTLEMRQPLVRGTEQFGSIRIGISTLLIRSEMQKALRPAALTASIALLVATLGAMFLAQWLLRPIHVLKAGLSRLGQGEVGVRLDMPAGDEFADLGRSFNTISEQLSAERSRAEGQHARLESAVDRLEDAVAMFSPSGELLFANSAMRALMSPDTSAVRRVDQLFPSAHPFVPPVERALRDRRGQPATSARVTLSTDGEQAAELLIVTHAIVGPDQRFVGVMLVARNVGYLSQLERTVHYSRKLAALGRLMAGVAHEVKNPLNAMTIHLELLKQKLAAAAAGRHVVRPPLTIVRGAAAGPRSEITSLADAMENEEIEPEPVESQSPVQDGVLKHVNIIAEEIRRLDRVVQGFLKFTKPEDLKLEPIHLGSLIEDIVEVVEPEASNDGVLVRAECSATTPFINGDRAMMRQALLNLALNACQAMPEGGTLRIACVADTGHRLAIEVEDTGVGIDTGNLDKIFDLYFTTKEKGSGIGLSMVYRIVQLHDGEIQVQSTPGRGSTFRLLLPRASQPVGSLTA